VLIILCEKVFVISSIWALYKVGSILGLYEMRLNR